MLYFDRRAGFENARLRYLLNARLRYSREATRSMSRVGHFISRHLALFSFLKDRSFQRPEMQEAVWPTCTGSKIPRDGWLKDYSDIWWFFCAFIPQQRPGCICSPCSLMGTVTTLFISLIWAPLELSNSFGAITIASKKNYRRKIIEECWYGESKDSCIS